MLSGLLHLAVQQEDDNVEIPYTDLKNYFESDKDLFDTLRIFEKHGAFKILGVPMKDSLLSSDSFDSFAKIEDKTPIVMWAKPKISFSINKNVLSQLISDKPGTMTSINKKIIKSNKGFTIQYGDQHKEIDLNTTEKKVMEILIANKGTRQTTRELAGDMPYETFKKARNAIVSKIQREILSVQKDDFIKTETGKDGWIDLADDVVVIES